MVKILLVNPIITTEIKELDFPLNLLYLASGLAQKASDVSVTILDSTYEYFALEMTGLPVWKAQRECIKKIWADRGPFDLVGISGLCDNFHLTIQAAEYIKSKFRVPVVIGGPHATFIAKDILKSFPYVDFVIRHEGVYPLTRLIDVVQDKLPAGDVPGLTYRSVSGRVVENGCDSDASCLLDITPDYDLLPLKKYLEMNPEMFIPVLAGMGCPYSCSYCTTSLMWHRKYRVLPPADIAATVAALKDKFPSAQYLFVHDNLLMDRKFSLGLCAEMKKTGVAWRCSSRLEHLAGADPLIDALAASGCKGVFVGIETVSDKMQRIIGKNIDAASALPLTRKLLARDIAVVFAFILGFPEENDGDRDQTLRLAFALKEAGAERINLAHLFPLPGTVYARKKLVFFEDKEELLSSNLLCKDVVNGLILRHKAVFSSFWRVADKKANTELPPSVTRKLHLYCAGHYRSFNYLFSRAGVRPVDLFKVLRPGAGPERFLNDIKTLLAPPHGAGFVEFFRYECCIKALADGSRAGSRVPKLPFGKRLSRRVILFRSTMALSDLLASGAIRGTDAVDKEAFFCLVDMGRTIESFEISKPQFAFLRKLCDKPQSRRKSLIGGFLKDPVEEHLMQPLRELQKIGVLADGN